MSLLGHTDALLISMRANKGGSPAGVAPLASYLFAEAPVHLRDIVAPRENRVQEFWTTSQLEGTRYGPDRPVYVLTSKDTFSAPEELAYDLQALKRAVIVGENTGGANPASAVPIDEHFAMAIPRAQARNPYTGSNWEGVGVRPDIAVSAEAARDSAYLLALLTVWDLQHSPAFIRDQVNRAIDMLLSQLGAITTQSLVDAGAFNADVRAERH
jgi:retinol-binding protein 3